MYLIESSADYVYGRIGFGTIFFNYIFK